jgi:hypothetical protein
MATSKKNQQISQSQYEEFRKGYAESLGFNPDSLTQEQEHQVIEAMAADGITAPSVKALPGSEVNPSNGNGAEIVTATAGKAAGKGEGNKKPPASLGHFDDMINQSLVGAAKQGKGIGKLVGGVFVHQLLEGRDEVIEGALSDSMISSEYAGMSVESFLSTI